MTYRTTLNSLTYVIGVSEGRGGEKAGGIRKKIFEEMAKIFSNVLKSPELQIQETQ